VPHQVDPASKSVRIPTAHKGIDGVQVVRWQDQDGLVQFIQSMLRDIPAERLPAVESAVCRLNHGLAWLGLDLNHAHGMLAFRVALPLVPRGGVEAREIQAAFRTAVKVGGDLAPIMARVVSGAIAPDAILDEVRRAMAAAPAAVPPVFSID
jgi:hypothetical protein